MQYFLHHLVIPGVINLVMLKFITICLPILCFVDQFVFQFPGIRPKRIPLILFKFYFYLLFRLAPLIRYLIWIGYLVIHKLVQIVCSISWLRWFLTLVYFICLVFRYHCQFIRFYYCHVKIFAQIQIFAYFYSLKHH